MPDSGVLPDSIDWRAWAEAGALLLGAVAVGLVVQWLLLAVLKRLARRTPWEIDERLAAAVRRPLGALLPLLAVMLVLPEIRRLLAVESTLPSHLASLLLIAAIAWVAIAVVGAVAAQIRAAHRVDVADNLEARRVHTQTTVLARVVVTLIVIIAVGAGLMTFPRAQQIGTSLLASAGIVGLAIGIAARPVLENLIAGLQLALAQPVRLDDVVIVEGEWGRIEEITATFVVVRIWDERRLVVPFSKFISEPFQNWTRTRADILGTAVLHADYRVPVQAVREELQRLVDKAEEWDGRVCGLQVVNATDRTVELRALVSAADAGKAWDLRCKVREGLIGFLQREHPGALPRTRVEVDPGSAGPEAVPAAEAGP